MFYFKMPQTITKTKQEVSELLSSGLQPPGIIHHTQINNIQHTEPDIIGFSENTFEYC